jgi:hypothetical protein
MHVAIAATDQTSRAISLAGGAQHTYASKCVKADADQCRNGDAAGRALRRALKVNNDAESTLARATASPSTVHSDLSFLDG